MEPPQISGCNTINYTESLISIAKIVGCSPPPPDHLLSVQNALRGILQDHLSSGGFLGYHVSVEIAPGELLQDHQEDSSIELPLLQQQPQYAPPGVQHEHHQEDSSIELPLLQQQQYAPPGVQHEHHQEDSSVENVHQQLLQLEGELKRENDEDSDDSSTDSAFQVPLGKPFLEYDTDMEIELYPYPLRKKEWEKLSKLPYCLREVDQPISSNSCIF
uniref:Uncharacterized protein n=1 Tax=Chenopodium quinoa TaxID=63459 RepID=A0A803KPU7_CHEQI